MDGDDDLARRLLALREPPRAPLSDAELEARFAAYRGRKTRLLDGNLSADELARARQFTNEIDDPELRRDLQVENAVLSLLAHYEGTAGADCLETDWLEAPCGLLDNDERPGSKDDILSPSAMERLRNLGEVDEETRREIEVEDMALRLLAEAEQEGVLGSNLDNIDGITTPTMDEVAQLLKEANEYSAIAKHGEHSSLGSISDDEHTALSPGGKAGDDPTSVLKDAEECRQMAIPSAQEANVPDEVDEARLMSSSFGETVSTLIELGLVKEAYEEQMAHCRFLFSKGKDVVDIAVLKGALDEAQRLKALT
eukprot:GEMP01075462.1.p1 GENE.GEMP01075462.1~~GEMP01075462.1.p1  ORF type:complete len:311 (+),score=90.91 GEMP01075462.1:197-1129(+)